MASWPGLLVTGNLDILHRPIVHNLDGSISTVLTITIESDGYQVLLPTVMANPARIVSNSDAISHYLLTGEHLGKFDTDVHAETYANALHNQQAIYYINPNPLDAPLYIVPFTVDCVKNEILSDQPEALYLFGDDNFDGITDLTGNGNEGYWYFNAAPDIHGQTNFTGLGGVVETPLTTHDFSSIVQEWPYVKESDSSQGSLTASVFSYTQTFTATGAVAGDMHIVSFACDTGMSITPPAGWTTVLDSFGSDGRYACYYAFHSTGLSRLFTYNVASLSFYNIQHQIVTNFSGIEFVKAGGPTYNANIRLPDFEYGTLQSTVVVAGMGSQGSSTGYSFCQDLTPYTGRNFVGSASINTKFFGVGGWVQCTGTAAGTKHSGVDAEILQSSVFAGPYNAAAAGDRAVVIFGLSPIVAQVQTALTVPLQHPLFPGDVTPVGLERIIIVSTAVDQVAGKTGFHSTISEDVPGPSTPLDSPSVVPPGYIQLITATLAGTRWTAYRHTITDPVSEPTSIGFVVDGICLYASSVEILLPSYDPIYLGMEPIIDWSTVSLVVGDSSNSVSGSSEVVVPAVHRDQPQVNFSYIHVDPGLVKGSSFSVGSFAPVPDNLTGRTANWMYKPDEALDRILDDGSNQDGGGFYTRGGFVYTAIFSINFSLGDGSGNLTTGGLYPVHEVSHQVLDTKCSDVNWIWVWPIVRKPLATLSHVPLYGFPGMQLNHTAHGSWTLELFVQGEFTFSVIDPSFPSSSLVLLRVETITQSNLIAITHGNYTVTPSPPHVPDTLWRHIVLVHDDTVDKYSLYVNGSLVISNAAPPRTHLALSGIFVDPQQSTYWSMGMGLWAFYEKILPPDRIISHSNHFDPTPHDPPYGSGKPGDGDGTGTGGGGPGGGNTGGGGGGDGNGNTGGPTGHGGGPDDPHGPRGTSTVLGFGTGVPGDKGASLIRRTIPLN